MTAPRDKNGVKHSKGYLWLVHTNAWLDNCTVGAEYDFFEAHDGLDSISWNAQELDIGSSPVNGRRANLAKELPCYFRVGDGHNRILSISDMPNLSDLSRLLLVGHLDTIRISNCKSLPIIPKIGYDLGGTASNLNFYTHADHNDWVIDFNNLPHGFDALTLNFTNSNSGSLKNIRVQNLKQLFLRANINAKLSLTFPKDMDIDNIANDPEYYDLAALILIWIAEHNKVMSGYSLDETAVNMSIRDKAKLIKMISKMVGDNKMDMRIKSNFSIKNVQHLINLLK